jgi:cytochrome c553
MAAWIVLGVWLALPSRAHGDCTLPPPYAAAIAGRYQAAIELFIGSGCFQQWPGDPNLRLTGATVSGTTYSVHDRIKVNYSPSMAAWMWGFRPPSGRAPATVGPVPDDAAMIATVYPVNGPATPSGYLIMVRVTAPPTSHAASGWFFSQFVTNPAAWGGTPLTTSAGDYSMGLCAGCHAAAVNNFTFAGTGNLLGMPLSPQLPGYVPNFQVQDTSTLQSALTPPPAPQLRSPLDDTAAQQFINFYNSAVPEFQKTPLPQVSSLPLSGVLSIPGESTDDVYLQAGQPSFVTSNQCQGCHDANALLAMQTGNQPRAWAPPQMSFKYTPTGPGAVPPNNKFNISQYGEWSVSIMALASRDPVFLAQVETERVLHAQVRPTSIDNFCYRCHGPMGQRQYHIDKGGDPTQFPPSTPPPASPDFSHFMIYSTPESCDSSEVGFPCDQPGAQAVNSRYGALARDGVSCVMCHHIGPPASGPARPDPWSVFYGFSNSALVALEEPLGLAYPFAGSMAYDLTRFVAPQPDLSSGFVGKNRGVMGQTPPPEIWGHQQSFNNASTVTPDYLPKGEFCGACHVVIAPEVPRLYPRVRNKDQILPNGQPKLGANYPGTDTPCPPVTAGADGKYDPTQDPCVQQSFEQTTYLEWAASTSFGGSSGPQASCTYCHMPDAQGNMMSIANTESPGNTDKAGGFPPVAWRADDKKLQLSSNAAYPRHRLMAINLFVHEMFQQFSSLLGITAVDSAMPADTIKNLQNAEETILTHAPTTVVLSLCTPGSANTPCANLQSDPKSLTYQVSVANQSGHRFPTGAGFRRGFLEVRLLDAGGKTLWVSGAVNAQGAIVDQTNKVLPTEFPPIDQKYDPQHPSIQLHFGSTMHPAITGQDQVQIYEARATDEYGKLTTSTTRLFGDVKDNRIPPAGWVPPYDCSGKRTAATAQPGTKTKNLDQFALSRITAPSGITGVGSTATIDPAGAFSDPDFCTPGGLVGKQPSGIAGVDHVLYKIPISALGGATVAKVTVVMHYQAIPPYFLRDRFLDGQAVPKSSEGGRVGLGAATERLLYVTDHLNMNINNTIPDQQNLPSQVATNWTMDIGSACLVTGSGASCAPQSRMSAERKKLQDVYDRQRKDKQGGAR